MTRSRVCFPGHSFSLRPRLYFLLAILFASAYIVFRSSDSETYTDDGFGDERLAHLGLDRVTYAESKGAGADFSPLKGLGVDRWVPGGKRKVLITGGAGQIGLALVPRLQEEYEVYVLDIQPRPSALLLPTSVRYYRSSTTSVEELLSQHSFSGIVNLAGVSILEWCEADPAKCEEANVGSVRDILTALEGGKQKRWWKGSAAMPWIVLGSGVEVQPEQGQAMSILGRTKAAAERTLKDHVEHGGSAPGSNVRAAIVRFSTIFGFHTRTVVSETFIHRALVNGAISGHTQYDSDAPPLDLIHVDDALDGIVAAIRKMDRRGADASLMTINLVSGSRTPQEQVVRLITELAGSKGTTKDIGAGRAAQQVWRTYDSSEAAKAIGWRPKHSLVSGLTAAIANIHRLNKEWTYAYLAHHCPTSSVLETPLDATTLLSNKNNRDLSRLDGCTVNIGFNRGGYLDYVKCPSKDEAGVKCTVDREKVVSYNWDASVFILRQEKGAGRRERKVRVRLEEEKGRGLLGLPALDSNGPLGFELLPTKADGQAVFDLEVSEDDSSLRFLLPNNSTQLLAASHASTNASILSLASASAFDVRMNVLCCPIEGDWPLLEDDYESADIRFGSTGDIPFNSSRRSATCSRAEEAWRHSTAMLETPPAAVKGKSTLQPVEWAQKDLPACWNDCSAPTVCVQTGSCRCVQAECPTRRVNPLSLASTAISPKPFSAGKSALGKLRPFASVLMNDVRAGNWEDLLLPSFRAQYGKNASLPALHVVDGYPGQEAIETAECHKLQPKHCFSADSIMYRAMRHISVPAEEAELIVLPVYQHCDGAKFLVHDVMGYARENIPGVRTGEKKVAIVLTHDWGICIEFAWEMWSARENHRLFPDWVLQNMLVWSVMGDYDSPCYRPQQDVVVPARSCQSPALKETFGDIENVMPARERPKLVTWAGTYWGTGKSERLRMTCDRGGAGERELVKGGGAQSDWISWDYMKNLGQARFCPQPRGIAGWSPRVNDAIYAGCIPVLTAEGTHYPYSTSLDWTKFSVRLLPTDLDRIEEILAAIPIEKVEELQRNLMLVRDAFIYSSDEAPEDELTRRGPMFWALQEAKTRMGMEYAM